MLQKVFRLSCLHSKESIGFHSNTTVCQKQKREAEKRVIERKQKEVINMKINIFPQNGACQASGNPKQ